MYGCHIQTPSRGTYVNLTLNMNDAAKIITDGLKATKSGYFICANQFLFVQNRLCAEGGQGGGWLSMTSKQVSLHTCHAQCQKKTQCGYFAFDASGAGDRNGHTCTLYAKMGGCREDEFKTYRLDDINSATLYTLSAGRSISGTADVRLSNGKTQDTGFSVSKCRNECTSKRACRSFVFKRPTGYCELWARSGPTCKPGPTAQDQSHELVASGGYLAQETTGIPLHCDRNSLQRESIY